MLHDGRAFDANSNARCSHLASIFKPDIQRGANLKTPIGGAGYHYSETYVRIAEPALLQLNQLILQDCIQLELGEMTPEIYANRMERHSVRYLALTFPAGPEDTATSILNAINESLSEQRGEPQLDVQRVEAEAVVAEESIARPGNGNFDVEGLRAITTGISVEQNAQPRPLVLVYLSNAWREEAQNRTHDDTPSRELIDAFTIRFETNSAYISPEQQAALGRFVEKHCCGSTFSVYGFADIRGPASSNLMLARLRTAKVAEQLENNNEQAVIEEVALGEGSMFGPDLSENRVVHIIVAEPK